MLAIYITPGVMDIMCILLYSHDLGNAADFKNCIFVFQLHVAYLPTLKYLLPPMIASSYLGCRHWKLEPQVLTVTR